MAKIKTVGLLDIDSSLDLDINSSGGAISIGNDAVAQGISIGTGVAAQSIKIGNTTSPTAIDFETGTGSFTVDTNTGNVITVLDSGEMTKPLQPAFLANLTSNDNNLTGNGAAYDIGTNVALTEVFDQNGDFNTNGTFTAPVTGRYQLSFGVRLSNVTSAMNAGIFEILTSNRSLSLVNDPFELMNPDNDQGSVFVASLLDMDASDTAVWRITISGGTGDTVDLTGVAGKLIFMSGFLVC